MYRDTIFQYVKKQYGTIPEYLWNDLPDSAILRNDNGKWYAVFMNLEGFKIGLDTKIGLILREARLNMNLEKSEIADVLGVTVEHYRKLEAGITGISVDKVLTLYHKYGIDPTYLITGESSMKDFNLDYYVANSTKEQRNEFFDRVLAYLSKLIR